MPLGQREAARLMLEGTETLSEMEANGIRIDTEYLQNIMTSVEDQIREAGDKLTNSKFYAAWKKVYGDKTNLNSHTQLGHVLFNRMGVEPQAWTATGKPKTDLPALEQIKHPFIKHFTQYHKLRKLHSTYLKGVAREVVDGFLHPVFNLHLVRSFRSSSDSPNFQNIPIRDKKIGKLIRQAFIPREGCQLVEVDYGGIEVRVAACYHKDPAMIRYIKNPKLDMHRDCAAECFMCEPGQIGKVERYCGKNMFVFPQFYGDYYIDCGKSLWDAMTQLKLEIDGVPVRKHLKRQGIRGLGSTDPKDRTKPGTFMKHIQEVENHFWNKRFQKYKRWKEHWWEEYLRKGYFKTLTGFVIRGVMKRNEVINYPVQGSAFHCLLWSLIELSKAIRKNKMKTKLVGQIHDSVVADVPEEEVEEYLHLTKEITCTRLRKAWDWIIVPLEIEAEVCPVGGTWFDKEEVPL